jgi:serine/threonine protein kinase
VLFHFALAPAAPVVPTLDAGEVATVLMASSVRYLGSGSFGETWAFTTAAGTRAAKFLLDPASTSIQIMREVEGLTRVSSANVVRLLEVNRVSLAAPVGPRVALIFEYIDGGDVAGLVHAGRWPQPAEASAFAEGALRGLAALHAREVVHRDVKPENLMLRGGDWARPVLLDLGLGRLLDASTLTIYPAMVGTAPFMAPEIIEGRAARKGSDLWSLGVVLYLLLTGNHPFLPDPAEALDPAEMYDRLVAGPPALPAGVPEPLATLVTRFLSAASYQRGSAARALADLAVAP